MSNRILIVDDDDDFNNLLMDVFTQADYQVEAIQNPLVAIDRIWEVDYDLIITDQRMPGMSGTDLVREVKGVKPDIPIVMVSGYLENENIRELIKMGVGGVFLKPLNIFSLLKKAGELIEQAKGEGTREGAGRRREKKQESRFAFPFTVFSGASPIASTFAEKLYTLRDFKTNLLLQGPPGADYPGICKDLIAFTEGKEERLLEMRAEDWDESELLQELRALEAEGVERVTFLVEEPKHLEGEALDLLFAVAKNKAPFSRLTIERRFVFVLDGDLDTLYDEGGLNEELYIFMGMSELEVPALKDCPEEIPHVCDRILSSLPDAAAEAALVTEAEDFLRDQDWPGDYRQLYDVLAAAVRRNPGGHLEEPEVRAAFEGNLGGGPEESDEETDEPADMSSFLRQQRDDYARAALELSKGNKAAAAKVLGVPIEALDTMNLEQQ